MSQCSDLGFTKIRGYSFWPARLAGQSGKKLWAKFFGTGEFGSVQHDKHWLEVSESTLAKFATHQNFKKANYKKAVRELIITAKE